MRFRECPICGAALDPGEKCDCQDKERGRPAGTGTTSEKGLPRAVYQPRDGKSSRAAAHGAVEIRYERGYHMKIKSLRLENFQGIAHAEFDFDGLSASIYGDNATGKTTVFNAVTWLLFDKASTGAKNFTPKTKGPDGEFLQKDFAYTGIFSLWGKRDPSRTDNTTALTAWAWALRRGMDMIEKDSMLDQGHVLLTGSSRLGKAALIAGAFDERFPVVVPNQTGGGGVPLAKRNFGETITTEMKSFTHWYCKAYGRYAGHEDIMPFDQHMLLTCVAPRALLVEGFDQPWFDTKGEFLSVQAASPVWKFLGKPGLPEVSWPDDYDTKAIGPVLGYVRRDQEHGIAMIDWLWMLDFADRQFSFDLDNHIGICGLGWAKQAKASGLNYLEANVVNQLCPESDEATFEQKLKEMKEAGLPIYSANGFFPGTIKLVGPEAETQRAIKYSRTAIRRAAQAGIKILVLGSSKARNIPEGFSTERAREQFLALLKGIAPDAEKYGVIVAIEPLQKSETNFINTVREGAEISRLTGSPNICVIADLFHMMRVGEGPDGIIDSADKLVNCHIAELEERTPPGEKGDDFTPYFKALKQIGFKGGISIECGWKDIEKQLPVAAKTMKEQINKIKQ